MGGDSASLRRICDSIRSDFISLAIQTDTKRILDEKNYQQTLYVILVRMQDREAELELEIRNMPGIAWPFTEKAFLKKLRRGLQNIRQDTKYWLEAYEDYKKRADRIIFLERLIPQLKVQVKRFGKIIAQLESRGFLEKR